MSLLGGKKSKSAAPAPEPPRPARRRENERSHIRAGRTISPEREHLETASERIAAHRAIKKKQNFRVIATISIFAILAAAVIFAAFSAFGGSGEASPTSTTVTYTYTPTIEVVDEDSHSSGITSRMKEYIGQAEADFRELGYTPVRAVIPTGSIREVDFYLDGVSGRIKLIIDRGTGVSVEDADRMLRYLAEQGISEFEYIDVRIDGKAYWK